MTDDEKKIRDAWKPGFSVPRGQVLRVPVPQLDTALTFYEGTEPCCEEVEIVNFYHTTNSQGGNACIVGALNGTEAIVLHLDQEKRHE